MVNPGNQKNNMTKTQPAGIHASTPWFINFLTSRCVQIAETIGMARITRTINNIPTMKKAGDFAGKSGIINADKKAKTTINPTTTICNINNPRKNNAFFIIPVNQSPRSRAARYAATIRRPETGIMSRDASVCNCDLDF